MSDDDVAFHALLDTVLQVNFPGPRNEDSLKDRFKTASNDVILRLFHEIVLDTERDAWFDKLVGLLQAVDDKHVDTPNVEGVTLLMQVADFKYLHGFKTLIDAGANPNAYDSTGRSVLHRVVSKDHCDWAKCNEIIKSMLEKLQECQRFRINPTASSYNNGKRTYLYALKEHDALLAVYFPQRVTCDDIDLFIAANAETSSTTVGEYMRDTRLDLIDICIRTNTYGPNLRSFNINDQFNRLDREIHVLSKWTLLHYGVSNNFEALIKSLGNRPAIDLNVLDTGSRTALYYAVNENNLPMTKFLIDKGANLDIRFGSVKETALHIAIKKDSQDIVTILLNANANPTVVNYYGLTALHIAVKKGELIVIQQLLDAKANPNVQTHLGLTPLHIAIENNKHDIVKQLLDAKANPNVQTHLGRTPLHTAIDHEQDTQLIVGTLLNHGADPNITDDAKETALHYAIKRSRDIIETLLGARANPNIRNAAGQTALHCAVEKGRCTIYAQLFEHGADPCVQDDQGQTILHYAAKNTKFDMASESAPWLATLDIQDNDGQTALHVAVICNHVFMIQYLLKVDANPNIRNADGQTALHLALKNRGIVPLLLQTRRINLNIRDDRNRTVLDLCVHGDIEDIDTATKLIKKGADPNVRTSENETLLMTVIQRNNFQMANLLIEKGADPNVRWKDEDGEDTFALMMATVEVEAKGFGKKADEALNVLKELVRMSNIDLNAMANLRKVNTSTYEASTALHYAVEHNLHEVVLVLLGAHPGIDLNVQDEQGNTALMLAVKGNHMDLVAALMNHPGVALNVQDNGGDTALMLAVKGNHLDLVVALMNHPGIDLNVQDNGGDTALMYAAAYNQLDVVISLMNHPRIDLNVQSRYNKYTALHHAVDNNHPAIVSQLLSDDKMDASLEDDDNNTALKRAIVYGYAKCVTILRQHERLLKKQSSEGERGGSSNRRNTPQSVIKLPFSKLKL
jgi:ankyrin repeat protein